MFLFGFPKLSDITGCAREIWLWVKLNFVHFSLSAKLLFCTPSRIKHMRWNIYKYFQAGSGFATLTAPDKRMWNMRQSTIMSFQLSPLDAYAEHTCKYHICGHIGHLLHYVRHKDHCSSQKHLLSNIECLVILDTYWSFFLYFYQTKYVQIFTEM